MDPRAQEAYVRIRTLTQVASDVQVDHEIPIQRYLRSGSEMLEKVKTLVRDGNVEAAYILYIKYLTLFVEKLHEHPDYAKMPVNERSNLLAKAEQAMTKAESLKHELMTKFQAEHEEYLTEKK